MALGIKMGRNRQKTKNPQQHRGGKCSLMPSGRGVRGNDNDAQLSRGADPHMRQREMEETETLAGGEAGPWCCQHQTPLGDPGWGGPTCTTGQGLVGPTCTVGLGLVGPTCAVGQGSPPPGGAPQSLSMGAEPLASNGAPWPSWRHRSRAPAPGSIWGVSGAPVGQQQGRGRGGIRSCGAGPRATHEPTARPWEQAPTTQPGRG